MCWLNLYANRKQTEKDLRCDVIGCATEGPSGVALHHALSTHPKVCYLCVPFTVQQDIIQLKISSDRGEREQEQNKYEQTGTYGLYKVLICVFYLYIMPWLCKKKRPMAISAA